MSFFVTSLIRFAVFRIPGVRLAIAALGLLIAFDIFLYAFLAMGLYSMAKRQQLRGRFLAWVPIGQAYILGALADAAAGGRMYRTTLACFPLSAVACAIAAFSTSEPASVALAWTAVGLTVVTAVFWFKALYWVYAQYVKAPRTLLVLSIIFFFVGPIVLFIRRSAAPMPLNARAHMAAKEKRPGSS